MAARPNPQDFPLFVSLFTCCGQACLMSTEWEDLGNLGGTWGILGDLVGFLGILWDLRILGDLVRSCGILGVY